MNLYKLRKQIFEVKDDETEGTNRTGNYSVLMKLDSNIPQLLPMAGRRIKIMLLQETEIEAAFIG